MNETDSKDFDLAQALHGGESGETAVGSEYIPFLRQAAAESVVLLKNNQVLPIREGERTAVFGRTAVNWHYVGYGSGGDIIRPYSVNLMQGLHGAGVLVDEVLERHYGDWTAANVPDEGVWGQWPMSFPEMPLSDEEVHAAAGRNDLALVVIGRSAGEDRENKLEPGSYYLTEEEKCLLRQVTAAFSRTAVLINAGNLIDMAWMDEFGDRIGAVAYVWQGGMESGNAVADVLTGKIAPSGRLTDTIPDAYDSLPSAKTFGGAEYSDYTEDIYVGYRYFETFAPEHVRYPFGFGLSYTAFVLHSQAQSEGTEVILRTRVTNTGSVPGREVVQVYVSAPQGVLGKPARELAAFGKTGTLQPGETETLVFTFDLKQLASYDDGGKTGHRSAFVLEAGDYVIYAGENVRAAQPVSTVHLDSLMLVRQCREELAVQPEHRFDRLTNVGGRPVYEPVPTAAADLRQEILDQLPDALEVYDGETVTFAQVRTGERTVEQLVSQLTVEELEALTRGEGPMNSTLGVPGNTGVFCGVTESLRRRGLPPVVTSDGPAGLRLERTACLLPCGTALASTFDLPLTEAVYGAVAHEMKYYDVHVFLGPGCNIHRNPLCGRNFEYFSEDPLLSARMAAAVVNAVEDSGGTACPKHFACNNQETNRSKTDARVSERALREIYLRVFERMLEESCPQCIMTSYNKINGVWNHYNFALAQSILRGEWDYDGVLVTDWWMQPDRSPEFPLLTNDGYRIRAGVDVYMPGEEIRPPYLGRTGIATLEDEGGITLGELQRIACRVIRLAISCVPLSGADK